MKDGKYRTRTNTGKKKRKKVVTEKVPAVRLRVQFQANNIFSHVSVVVEGFGWDFLTVQQQNERQIKMTNRECRTRRENMREINIFKDKTHKH